MYRLITNMNNIKTSVTIINDKDALNMFTWRYSVNMASIKFKCTNKLIQIKN